MEELREKELKEASSTAAMNELDDLRSAYSITMEELGERQLKKASATAAMNKSDSDDLGSLSSTPEEFICALSHHIMIEPVILSCGHTFERSFITEYLKHSRKCLENDELLSHGGLSPNLSLSSLIGKWIQEHGSSLVNVRVKEAAQIKPPQAQMMQPPVHLEIPLPARKDEEMVPQAARFEIPPAAHEEEGMIPAAAHEDEEMLQVAPIPQLAHEDHEIFQAHIEITPTTQKDEEMLQVVPFKIPPAAAHEQEGMIPAAAHEDHEMFQAHIDIPYAAHDDEDEVPEADDDDAEDAPPPQGNQGLGAFLDMVERNRRILPRQIRLVEDEGLTFSKLASTIASRFFSDPRDFLRS